MTTCCVYWQTNSPFMIPIGANNFDGSPVTGWPRSSYHQPAMPHRTCHPPLPRRRMMMASPRPCSHPGRCCCRHTSSCDLSDRTTDSWSDRTDDTAEEDWPEIDESELPPPPPPQTGPPHRSLSHDVWRQRPPLLNESMHSVFRRLRCLFPVVVPLPRRHTVRATRGIPIIYLPLDAPEWREDLTQRCAHLLWPDTAKK